MGLLDAHDEECLTVSAYTTALKRLLETSVAACWVLGEVSNLRKQSSGHFYFALKDAGAQLPVVMFRGSAIGLGFEPRDGMEVMVYGEISVYEPHGRYQLVARAMRESGQGKLFREFERLKRALAAEGLFAPEKKRPLPLLPLRVAVVTSPTGAALQDFLRILQRRQWAGSVRVLPVKVQGIGAWQEVAGAIRFAGEAGDFDVVVVCRGGGSLEDLWSFNEEGVARAVAACPIPLISAIGHETDFSLCDFAADVRAETPSAAAELISSAFLVVLERLRAAKEAFEFETRNAIDAMRSACQTLALRLKGVSPEAKLERAFLRIDDLESRLWAASRQALQSRRDQLSHCERRLERADVRRRLQSAAEAKHELAARFYAAFQKQVTEHRRRFDEARIRIEALSPMATLARGFAFLERPDGSVLSSVRGVKVGDALRARLKDGSVELRADADGRGA